MSRRAGRVGGGRLGLCGRISLGLPILEPSAGVFSGGAWAIGRGAEGRPAGPQSWSLAGPSCLEFRGGEEAVVIGIEPVEEGLGAAEFVAGELAVLVGIHELEAPGGERSRTGVWAEGGARARSGTGTGGGAGSETGEERLAGFFRGDGAVAIGIDAIEELRLAGEFLAGDAAIAVAIQRLEPRLSGLGQGSDFFGEGAELGDIEFAVGVGVRACEQAIECGEAAFGDFVAIDDLVRVGIEVDEEIRVGAGSLVRGGCEAWTSGFGRILSQGRDRGQAEPQRQEPETGGHDE